MQINRENELNTYLQEIDSYLDENDFRDDIEDFMNVLTMPFNQLPQLNLSDEFPHVDHGLNEAFIFWEEENEEAFVNRLGENQINTYETFEEVAGFDMNIAA